MAQDWIGNANSVYKVLGATNHSISERQTDDYYATDPIAIDKLLGGAVLPPNIWECACGAGHLAMRLVERGYYVVATDLRDRGYGYINIDFLKQTALPESLQGEECCILTNPPYKYATEFVEKALELLPEGQPAIFLLRTQALEGKGRHDRLFSKGYLHEVYQFKERVMCAKNGDFNACKAGGGGAVSYAWFVFRKTPCSTTHLHWI